jgi:hypothetical protein
MVRATIIKLIKGRFDVREEGDGEAGWQTLMLDPGIQVLISDLSMPKLDGYGLLAARARIEDRAHTRDAGHHDFGRRGRSRRAFAPRNAAPRISSPRESARRNCWRASTRWSSWRKRATNWRP